MNLELFKKGKEEEGLTAKERFLLVSSWLKEKFLKLKEQIKVWGEKFDNYLVGDLKKLTDGVLAERYEDSGVLGGFDRRALNITAISAYLASFLSPAGELSAQERKADIEFFSPQATFINYDSGFARDTIPGQEKIFLGTRPVRDNGQTTAGVSTRPTERIQQTYPDSIRDNSSLYGYRYFGTRMMLGGKTEVGYYGKNPKDLTGKFKGPFSAQRNNEMVVKLGNVLPGMGLGGFGLFANFEPDGDMHLVELSGDVDVFVLNEKVYALGCGNLLCEVAIPGDKSSENIEVTPPTPKPTPIPSPPASIPSPERPAQKQETFVNIRLIKTTQRLKYSTPYHPIYNPVIASESFAVKRDGSIVKLRVTLEEFNRKYANIREENHATPGFVYVTTWEISAN